MLAAKPYIGLGSAALRSVLTHNEIPPYVCYPVPHFTPIATSAGEGYVPSDITTGLAATNYVPGRAVGG